jgi:hypothetical protein
MEIKLSTLAEVMGLGLALPQIYGLVKPAAFAQRVRKFPRSLPVGIALMLLATAWFAWNFSLEQVSDFAAYKQWMMWAFVAIGVGACVYLQDYLAVRGLAVVFLLLGKLMVDTARWQETDWRWVISGWAYLLVVAGMWFTVWPWHLRDLLNWATANNRRVVIGSAIRLAFGLFVALLGFTVY